MNVSLTLENSLFETFGALGSFNLSQMIWSKYEKFAIPKIEAGTVSLRGTMSYFNALPEVEARKLLESLESYIEVLASVESQIMAIDDNEFSRFRNATLEYFATLQQAQELLFETAHPHFSYQMSEQVLAEDWNAPENDIWDKY